MATPELSNPAPPPDAFPAGDPSARPVALSTVETDLLCLHCGYNLHTQPVWRDERLGLFVCRCPECGRHANAAANTTVTALWQRRVLPLAAVLWLLAALYIVCGAVAMFVLMQQETAKVLTEPHFEDARGRAVEINLENPERPIHFLDDPTRAPIGPIHARPRLAPWLGGPPADARWTDSGTKQIAVGLAVAGLGLSVTAGIIFAVGSWYWHRRLMYLWLLLPLVAVAITYVGGGYEPVSWNIYSGVRIMNDPSVLLGMTCVAVIALLQLMGMTVGLRFGRPIVRGMSRVFIPPGLRQSIAFLWLCDNLTPPPGRLFGDGTAARA